MGWIFPCSDLAQPFTSHIDLIIIATSLQTILTRVSQPFCELPPANHERIGYFTEVLQNEYVRRGSKRAE